MAANYVQTYLCKLLRKFMFETSLLNDFHEKTGKKENLNMAAFYRFWFGQTVKTSWRNF